LGKIQAKREKMGSRGAPLELSNGECCWEKGGGEVDVGESRSEQKEPLLDESDEPDELRVVRGAAVTLKKLLS